MVNRGELSDGDHKTLDYRFELEIVEDHLHKHLFSRQSQFYSRFDKGLGGEYIFSLINR